METKKVLVVDDESANIFLIEGLLSENNYEVKTADDGLQCLSVLEEFIPDVILLDIMMPNLSGVDTLKKIKETDVLKDIPVIMVSAKTNVREVEKCLNLGATDYIRKPFEEVELLARINVAYQLGKKEKSLKKMISQKEDFVKMISHDLRSPFTTIQGFSELLLLDDNIDEEQQMKIQFIIDSVNFSVEYFNKLLSWSKLEEGDVVLQRWDTDLNSLIQFCIEQNSTKLEAKKIACVNNVPLNLEVSVDDVFFKQTINNLISNAVKFTNVNGEININLDKDDNNITLSVCDNGVGMDEKTRESLFSNSIVKSTRGTEGEKGTGIGLFICKRICDAHNFQISVSSEINEGTCFEIIIPNQ